MDETRERGREREIMKGERRKGVALFIFTLYSSILPRFAFTKPFYIFNIAIKLIICTLPFFNDIFIDTKLS